MLNLILDLLQNVTGLVGNFLLPFCASAVSDPHSSTFLLLSSEMVLHHYSVDSLIWDKEPLCLSVLHRDLSSRRSLVAAITSGCEAAGGETPAGTGSDRVSSVTLEYRHPVCVSPQAHASESPSWIRLESSGEGKGGGGKGSSSLLTLFE